MLKILNKNFYKLTVIVAVPLFFVIAIVSLSDQASAAPPKRSECNETINPDLCKKRYNDCKTDKCKESAIKDLKKKPSGGRECGMGDRKVITKINFGCSGKVENPIYDIAFAIIRFLSIGVGVFSVASIVYAGVRYAASEGNPETTAAAKDRVRTTIIAFILYLFIFALIQYLVPGGLFSR